MPKTPVVALLICALQTTAFAQKNFLPGGIVLQNGDTLSGQIDYRDWDLTPSQIQFKAGSTAATQAYTAQTIAGFFLTKPGVIYQSAVVYLNQESTKESELPTYGSVGEATRGYQPVQDTVFLEVLARGQVNLFEYTDHNQNHFLAQPQGDTIRELVNRKIIVNDYLSSQPVYRKPMQVSLQPYRQQLQLLTLDCQARKTDFNKVSYFRENLIRLVDGYNKCRKNSDYRKVSPRPGRNFYLLAGAGHPIFTIEGPYTFQNRIESPAGIAPLLGLGGEFDLGRSRGRRAIGLELYGSRFSVERQADKPVDYIIVYADLSYLRMITFFRYQLGVGRMRPYLKLGAGGSYYTQHNLDYTKSIGLGTPLEFSRKLKSYDLCFTGGLGARINRFAVEARFEYGTNMAYFDASELARTSVVSLIASYQIFR